MSIQKKQLSREDWILAGFRALAKSGAQALKAEPLARALKTTKGSFYWHFKDVADFQTQMLTYWEAKAFTEITVGLAAIPDPKQRLFMLGEISTTPVEAHGGNSGEPAIRAWGQSNPEVAAAIARIDQSRLAYVRETLAELGDNDPEHARIIYAAYIGFGTLSVMDNAGNNTAMAKLISAILAP